MIRVYRDHTFGVTKKTHGRNLFKTWALESIPAALLGDGVSPRFWVRWSDRHHFFSVQNFGLFFGRQRKSLDRSRTNCEQKSLQVGPLLVINGVRTPINGRKINVFHWGYFTLYVELFGTLLLTGDFGPILNFEVPITEVQLLDLCPKNNYYTWQNLCPLLKA